MEISRETGIYAGVTNRKESEDKIYYWLPTIPSFSNIAHFQTPSCSIYIITKVFVSGLEHYQVFTKIP